MAATMSDIQAILGQEGVPFFLHPDGKTAVVPGVLGGKSAGVFIHVEEEGRFLMLRVPFVHDAAKSPCKEKLFAKLLGTNRSMKLGRFGYDPTDGEVCLEQGIVVEDGELTSRQLMRTLMVLMGVVQEHCATLEADEGPDVTEEQITDTLQRLFTDSGTDPESTD